MSDDDQRWKLLWQKLREQEIAKIFGLLNDASISPICIKGWSIARFYPEESLRPYTDTDIAVPPDDYERVTGMAREGKFHGLRIDLHKGLRTLDKVSWEDLFDRSYEVDLNGTAIRVLADEDNLRVTATHWLIDGGVYEDRLNDIYFLVKNRKDNFDWDLCLESAGPVRKGWVIAAIAAAREYKGLDVSDLPKTIRAFELPNWFRKNLEKEWSRGPYLRMPIWNCLGKPKLLVEQIRRRFPPNKIAATVDVEGNIESGGRLPYQLKSLSRKIKPAIMGLYRRYIANLPTSNDQRHV